MQVIVFMMMLTRSSEIIWNPMRRYTGRSYVCVPLHSRSDSYSKPNGFHQILTGSRFWITVFLYGKKKLFAFFSTYWFTFFFFYTYSAGLFLIKDKPTLFLVPPSLKSGKIGFLVPKDAQCSETYALTIFQI